MKKPSNKPVEGDAVSVRLDDGRFALGVIARVETARPRKPYGIFVYFFGPYVKAQNALASPAFVKPANAVAKLNTSALGIYDGTWGKLGRLPDWNRDDWPFPDFYAENDFTGQLHRVTFSEDTLVTEVRRVPLQEKGNLERNDSHGSGAAQWQVSRAVEGRPSLDTVVH